MRGKWDRVSPEGRIFLEGFPQNPQNVQTKTRSEPWSCCFFSSSGVGVGDGVTDLMLQYSYELALVQPTVFSRQRPGADSVHFMHAAPVQPLMRSVHAIGVAAQLLSEPIHCLLVQPDTQVPSKISKIVFFEINEHHMI